MRLKLVFAVVTLVLFASLTIVSAQTSCSDNDRIMKLYSSNNSHGALWNYANYNYDICYTDIFGYAYVGADPHLCTGGNKVLELYQTSNSHAQVNEGPNAYLNDVCYGDLVCEADSSAGDSCSNEGKVVVRLYQDRNSHISNASFTSYGIKICCRSTSAGLSVGEPYWTDMRNVIINKSDLNDLVKLFVSGTAFTGRAIEFEIREKQELLGVDWFWPDSVVAQSSSSGFTTWRAGDTKSKMSEGLFYFKARVDGGSWVSTKDNTNENYRYLEVTSPEDNSAPTAKITSPSAGGIYFVGEDVYFNQGSFDVDDFIDYTWDLGDGSVRTGGTDPNEPNYYANYNFTYQYTTGGQMNIILKVVDDRGARSEYRIPILIIDNRVGADNQYVLARIDYPKWNSYVKGYNISFDASSSFAIETRGCDGTTCMINCLAGGCPMQTSGGTTTNINDNGRRGTYSDLNFSWTFDDGSSYKATGDNGRIFKKAFGRLGKHSAQLSVSLDMYNKVSSTGTTFILYLEQACKFDFDSGTWLWWDWNATSHEPREEKGYCIGTDGINGAGLGGKIDDCCPPGYSCQTSNGLETALCEVSADDKCSNIVICEDYLTEDECLEDICERGLLQPGTGCGGTIKVDEVCGAESYTSREDECLCVWDDSAQEGEKCSHGSNLWSSVFTTLPVIHSCKSKTTHENCIDGLMNMKVESTMSWNSSFINEFLVSHPTDFSGSTEQEAKSYLNRKCSLDKLCGNYEGLVVCGKSTTKLKFFTITSLIIVVAALIIIYIILVLKKVKKRKAVKKNVKVKSKKKR